MKFDALVLNAPLRQSLVTVRSLGRRGLRVAAVSVTPDAATFASRWCQEAVVFAAEDGSEAYRARLEEWLGKNGANVVIPSHDGTIAMLRRHRAQLQQQAHLALADEPSLTVAVNKERTLAVAKGLGLRVPREVMVQDLKDIPVALREIGLPAVIKPCESWLPQGAEGTWVGPQLVVTPEEAHQSVERVTRFGGAILWQQFLTGRREAISFLYVQGEMYARFAQWAQRTRPPLGGESVLRQSIAIPPDIGEGAEALIREINLEGYSEVEFRRDAAGVPYLMEINPRLSASVGIAVRAGVDFPYLLYRWANGEPLQKVESYRTGGWMRHLGGDIETTLATIEERGRPGITPPARALFDFGIAFFMRTAYDYLDWNDIGPAVRASARYTMRLLRRIGSRMRKVLS